MIVHCCNLSLRRQLQQLPAAVGAHLAGSPRPLPSAINLQASGSLLIVCQQYAPQFRAGLLCGQVHLCELSDPTALAAM